MRRHPERRRDILPCRRPAQLRLVHRRPPRPPPPPPPPRPPARPAAPADAAHHYAAAVPLSGLAVEIAAHSREGRNRFEIRLDPPELGRIDVRLDVDHDGRVASRLVVERSDTLDLLRRDAPALER